MDRRDFFKKLMVAAAWTTLLCTAGARYALSEPLKQEILLNDIRGTMRGILRQNTFELNADITRETIRSRMINYLTEIQTEDMSFRVFCGEKSVNGIVMDVWIWINDEFYLLNAVHDLTGIRFMTVKITPNPKRLAI